MKPVAFALIALLSPLALAQDMNEQLEPPTESEWRAVQERKPLAAPDRRDPIAVGGAR